MMSYNLANEMSRNFAALKIYISVDIVVNNKSTFLKWIKPAHIDRRVEIFFKTYS